MLPAGLPSTAFVDIVGTVDDLVFISHISGTWCTGLECGADDGLDSSWRAGGVPEPSTWAMILIGFAGLGYAGYRKSRRAGASAA
jgi:PEP-CTERM motif